jgi:triosephosphate isomerase
VALENNLKVILCVGENSNIRKKGIKSVKNFIKSQLQKDLKNIENCKLKIENFIVAYEPIWAIGTGNYCNSENALEIIKFIKNFLKAKSSKLKVKILYGGSVNNKNINNYLKYKEIDGVLVGSASVNQKELNLILKNLNV